MNAIVTDALVDSLEMVPFLLAIYLLVGWLEQRLGAEVQEHIREAGAAGPALGALFGIIPQCGFSVMASGLYARRLLTLGTLMAVYLSTSDEALPVILAQPQKIRTVIPILSTKVVVALLAGHGLDLLSGRRSAEDAPALAQEEKLSVHACCDHDLTARPRGWRLLVHPLVHTGKVFLFVFVVTLGLNYLMTAVGQESLRRVLLQESPLQPVVTALVGLIPNCAASVVITQMYLKGGLSFGSAISGLCAAAGLGLLVLVKENDRRDTLKIVALLLLISVAAGLLLQCCFD